MAYPLFNYFDSQALEFRVRQRLIEHKTINMLPDELIYKIGCLVLNRAANPWNIERVQFIWRAGKEEPSIFNGMKLRFVRDWTNERKFSWSLFFHKELDNKIPVGFSLEKKLLVSCLSHVDLGRECHTCEDFTALISSTSAQDNIRYLALPSLEFTMQADLFVDAINNLKNLTTLDMANLSCLGINKQSRKKLRFPKLEEVRIGSTCSILYLNEIIVNHKFQHLIVKCKPQNFVLWDEMHFLEALTLTIETITDDAISNFQKFANISKLCINCEKLNDRVLAKILLEFKMLKTLVLKDCHEITHEGINSLQDHLSLKCIEIKNCKKVNKKEFHSDFLKEIHFD